MKKLIVFLLVFSLVGCTHTEIGSDNPIAAYISEHVTKVDVTHYIGGKTTQWILENNEVTDLRNWMSQLQYEMFEFEKGNSPGDSDGGEFYNFLLSEEDYLEFSYVINGVNDCYLLIEGNWYYVLNPSDPPVTKSQVKRLTIEKVKELSEKGVSLSWSDFNQYSHEDVGSGIYIYAYDINENYYLHIGGESIQNPPLYIYLFSKADDSKYIDIRTESIDDFINSLNK